VATEAERTVARTLRFDGVIAGLGTDSGTRLVVGMWSASPFGAIADVMIEDAGGHRTLLAPRQEVADFIAATYVFDEIRVEAIALREDDRSLIVCSPSLRVELRLGRAPEWGGCWVWCRDRCAERDGGVGRSGRLPEGCVQAFRPSGRPAVAVASTTALLTNT